MLNDEVCRAMTDKQTNKQTHTHKTYILSKNWGNLFLTAKFFIFYFYFSNSLNVKKAVSKNATSIVSATTGFVIFSGCFKPVFHQQLLQHLVHLEEWWMIYSVVDYICWGHKLFKLTAKNVLRNKGFWVCSAFTTLSSWRGDNSFPFLLNVFWERNTNNNQNTQ